MKVVVRAVVAKAEAMVAMKALRNSGVGVEVWVMSGKGVGGGMVGGVFVIGEIGRNGQGERAMGIVGCLPASEDMNCLSDLLWRVLDPWHESEA